MTRIRKLSALIAGLILAELLCACSTETLTAGATLAATGQSAAAQMAQNATLSATTMNSLRKAVAFNDGYNGVPDNPDSQVFIKNTNDVQNKLGQYSKLLDSLSASYSALANLSSYDASGSFNTSFLALSKDTNTFLQSVHSAATVPAEAEIGTGLGLLGGAIQADEVKQASQSIKSALKTLIPVLDDPNTRKLLLLNKREVVAQIDQAATTIYAEGVYSYEPLLDDLGAPMNLKSDAQSAAIVAKSDKLKRGLRNVTVELANEQSDELSDSYDQSVLALKALIPLHESLENGAPLNLSSATTIVARLNTIATTLQKSGVP